jgi:hypothetical protein
MFPIVSGAHLPHIATRGRVQSRKTNAYQQNARLRFDRWCFNPYRRYGIRMGSSEALDNVVPAPPKIDITVNPKKPLTPLKVEVETPDGKLKVEPSPVPAPPVVHANGNLTRPTECPVWDASARSALAEPPHGGRRRR